MAAYGFDVKTMTESQCVAELFKLYQELTRRTRIFPWQSHTGPYFSIA